MFSKKYIVVTLVLFMLFASLSSIAGARFRLLSESSKEIHDTGRMHCISITDDQELVKDIWVINADDVEPFIIPTEVKGYYPINQNKITNEFKIENLEVEFQGTRLFIISCIIDSTAWPMYRDYGYLPIWLTDIEATDQPEPESKLEFDISVDQTFMIGDPIPVVATLRNAGERVVKLCEMNLKIETLDFLIQTPDGLIIQYIGPTERDRRPPEIKELNPGDKLTYSFEDITEEDMFGTEEHGSYEFDVGIYSIEGVYISSKNNDVMEEDVWVGELTSAKYDFEIIKDEPAENLPPNAKFSYSPLDPTTSDTVSFVDESSDSDGTIESRYWNFGDGNISTDQNPMHQYALAGEYYISLNVTDDDGVTDEYKQKVKVGSGEDPIPPKNGTITGRVVTIVIPEEIPDEPVPIPVEFIPISGADVDVYSCLDLRTVLYNNNTDGNGNFTITGVVPGIYILNVTAEGYQSRLTVAYVIQGRTTHIPFILLMPEKEQPVR